MKEILKKILTKTVSEKNYLKISSLYIVILLKYIDLVFRHKKIITIAGGHFKMVIDPKNGFTDKMLYMAKFRDKDITDILDTYLKKGSTFIDIGMNIGYETLWAAHLVKESGKVISFEPLSGLIEQTKESLNLNKFTSVTIVQKALGIEEGSLDIYQHEKDAGLSSLVNKNNSFKKEVVSIGKLDTELKNVKSINLIKIDVEGYEYEVLCGGKEVIQKFLPPIIFEFTPHMYEELELGRSKKILNYFVERNYALHLLTKAGPVLIDEKTLDTFIEIYLKKKTALNLLACQINK